MNYLMTIGLVLRLHENNARNEGIEWALQLDDEKIRFDLLQERKAKQEETQQKRTQKARDTIAQMRGGLSNNHTPQEPSVGQKTDGGGIVGQSGGDTVGQGGGGTVGQYTQKPIKTKEKNMEPETHSQSPIFPTSAKQGGQEHMGADAPARAFSTNPEKRIADFPEDCQEGARLMLEVFNVQPPKRPARDARGGTFALWINGLRELNEVAVEYNIPLPRAMKLTYSNWNQATFRVSHPGALKKTMVSALAMASLAKSKIPGDPNLRSESPLENFKPRGQK